jgi:PadR family transcriptional regulator PadR
VLRLDNDAYGMEVRAEIEKRTRRDVSYGAVYTALDRLQRKGFVSCSLGEATPERGGRARKYFRVEAAGREALRATRRALDVMWDGVAP